MTQLWVCDDVPVEWSDVVPNLLSVLVGGVVALVGSLVANRMAQVQNTRIAIYEGLLRELELSVTRGDEDDPIDAQGDWNQVARWLSGHRSDMDELRRVTAKLHKSDLRASTL